MVIEDISNLPSPWDSDMPLVAVDNGYAQQKVAYWGNVDGHKKLVCFAMPSRAQMGRINITLDGHSSGVYSIDGTEYTVSERVLEPDSIRSSGYAFSEVNLALVNHSLVTAGFGDKQISLGTGLPFDDYFKSGSKNEEFLDKVKLSFKTDCSSIDGKQLAVLARHNIYPESTAAFVDFAFDEDSMEIRQTESFTVVIDMGGNTTDITMINGGAPTINTEKSSSRRLGVLNIRDELNTLLKAELKLDNITDFQLDSAIRTNTFRYFNENKDISELLKKAKAKTVKRIITYVNETIGDGSYLENILFVGGGAEILKDEFLEAYPQGTVMANPEFSNARGMLKFMTYVAAND